MFTYVCIPQLIIEYMIDPSILRLVCQEWNIFILNNNKEILDEVYTVYGSSCTMFEIARKCIKTKDLYSLRRLAYEYTGRMNLKWQHLVCMIEHIDDIDILHLMSGKIQSDIWDEMYSSLYRQYKNRTSLTNDELTSREVVRNILSIGRVDLLSQVPIHTLSSVISSYPTLISLHVKDWICNNPTLLSNIDESIANILLDIFFDPYYHQLMHMIPKMDCINIYKNQKQYHDIYHVLMHVPITHKHHALIDHLTDIIDEYHIKDIYMNTDYSYENGSYLDILYYIMEKRLYEDHIIEVGIEVAEKLGWIEILDRFKK